MNSISSDRNDILVARRPQEGHDRCPESCELEAEGETEITTSHKD